MSADSVISLPSGISQRQIADAIGVSISTVSRALAGHPQVSPRTREAVERAIERLQREGSGDTGTTRSPMIVLTRSHLVEGRSTPSLEIILEQILGSAETAAWDAGYTLYMVHDSRLLRRDVNAPMLQDVCGVILAGGVVSDQVVASVLEYDVPVVLIGGHLPGRDIASVASDSFQGMRSAVAHLISLGHRRIGLVNGPSDTYTSLEKKAGYLTALAEAGISVDLELIRWRDGYSGFESESATGITRELLDLPESPSALVFATDGMALAGMAVCRARGLAIPSDISIVGFHDDPDARLADPHLTTVQVDRYEWGAEAVRRLLRAQNEPRPVGDRLLLPTRLIVRESTAPYNAERSEIQ